MPKNSKRKNKKVILKNKSKQYSKQNQHINITIDQSKKTNPKEPKQQTPKPTTQQPIRPTPYTGPNVVYVPQPQMMQQQPPKHKDIIISPPPDHTKALIDAFTKSNESTIQNLTKRVDDAYNRSNAITDQLYGVQMDTNNLFNSYQNNLFPALKGYMTYIHSQFNKYGNHIDNMNERMNEYEEMQTKYPAIENDSTSYDYAQYILDNIPTEKEKEEERPSIYITNPLTTIAAPTKNPLTTLKKPPQIAASTNKPQTDYETPKLTSESQQQPSINVPKPSTIFKEPSQYTAPTFTQRNDYETAKLTSESKQQDEIKPLKQAEEQKLSIQFSNPSASWTWKEPEPSTTWNEPPQQKDESKSLKQLKEQPAIDKPDYVVEDVEEEVEPIEIQDENLQCRFCDHPPFSNYQNVVRHIKTAHSKTQSKETIQAEVDRLNAIRARERTIEYKEQKQKQFKDYEARISAEMEDLKTKFTPYKQKK